jgi:hypothetical protein
MKRITISYTEKEEAWINQHPEINISALFRRMIDYLSERESLTLQESDAVEIARTTKKRELGV